MSRRFQFSLKTLLVSIALMWMVAAIYHAAAWLLSAHREKLRALELDRQHLEMRDEVIRQSAPGYKKQDFNDRMASRSSR
jgi:hypothetical protein